MRSSDLVIRVANKDVARELTTKTVWADLNFDFKDTNDASPLPVEVRVFGTHTGDTPDDIRTLLDGFEHTVISYTTDPEG